MESTDTGTHGSISNLGVGFLLGAVVGVAIGLLYAPRAGIETRHFLAEKAEEVKEKVNEAVDVVKEKASTLRSHHERAI